MSSNAWEAFWDQQEEEARNNLEESGCPVRQQTRKIVFVSTSRGRGKKKRPAREVQLLQYGGKCFTWRDSPNNALDRIATEVMGLHVLPGESAWEAFYRRYTNMGSS